MKKTALKAFTLVEMLIVIVIIGILIAALLPRLQGAQGMARDTARQTGLSQLQSAIVAYQSLNGKWPNSTGTDSPTSALNTNNLKSLVTSSIMSSLPSDPNLENDFSGLQISITGWGFGYIVLTKNSVKKAGFVLLAKTETPGKSNRVMSWAVSCSNSTITATDGCISEKTDMVNIYPCKTITLGTAIKTGSGSDQACTYVTPDQLFYIVTY